MSAAGVPRRARVPAVSCLACRVGRRRCDQGRPACGRCASSGHACTYPEGGTWAGADLDGRPPRRKTACNNCRAVRKPCHVAGGEGDPDGAQRGSGDGPCARCLERGIECVFPAPGEKGFRSRPPDSGPLVPSSDYPPLVIEAAFPPPVATSPAAFLPLLPAFFEVAESLWPVFHGPTFLAAAAAGRALPLAVDAAVLVALRHAAEAGDPSDPGAPDVRPAEVAVLAGLRTAVADISARGITNLAPHHRPQAVGALVFIIVWSHYIAMLDLAKEMTPLAVAWAHEAGLAEMGVRRWEDVFPGLVGARDADEARRMPLAPAILRGLRDAWGDHILPARTCILLTNMAGARRDWARRDEAVPHELLAVSSGPVFAVVAASAAEDWDARTAPPVPLVGDMLAWMAAEPGSPEREAGLAALPGYFLRARAVGTTLFTILRARTDDFIARCRAAGLRTPFLLGTGAAGDDEGRLLALRARLDADILGALSALPPEEAALGAAGLVSAMEPAHGFLYSWQIAHYLPSLRVMRLELYSSFGAFLLESKADAPGSDGLEDDVHAVGEAVANEIGTGGIFLGMLDDVIHTTQFLRQLIELNPRLYPAGPLQGSLALRVTLINIFLYHRLAAGATPSSPPDPVAAGLAEDVQTSFSVLGAMADRFPRTPVPRQLAFARRVAARARVAGADVDGAHQRDGGGERAFRDGAAALGKLLEAAYGARVAAESGRRAADAGRGTSARG